MAPTLTAANGINPYNYLSVPELSALLLSLSGSLCIRLLKPGKLQVAITAGAGMIESNPLRRGVFQNAWVVDNLESAIDQWATTLGVGPFFVTEYQYMFQEVLYRGQPGILNMRVALAQNDPIQIELIEPLSSPSAYRDSVSSGTGFHHMCAWSNDVSADVAYLAELGYPAANTAKIRDIEIAYVDTRPLLGCMLEFVTINSATQARFAEIAAAGKNWDGTDPIRS